MKHLLLVAVMTVMMPLSGCVAVLAGTAGAVIADEGFNENDGKFDPFENTEIGREIYD